MNIIHQEHMATNRIPSHKVADIVAAATRSIGKVSDGILVKIPRHLLSPIMRESERAAEPETNDRFYVDETNMTERRFLQDATTEFETIRDIDPFAGAHLHPLLVDCMLAHPMIQSTMSTIQTSRFLSGNQGSTTTLLDIAPLLHAEASFESGRTRYLKEHPDELITKDAVSSLVEPSADEHTQARCLAFLIGQPVVFEDESGSVRTLGPSPTLGDATVYWVRSVVDGFLGITMTADEAEQRFKDSSLTRYNPDPCLNGSPLLRDRRLRVAHLREAYASFGEDVPKKIKKAELALYISERCIWGIHIQALTSALA